jgi:hypothetical protein
MLSRVIALLVDTPDLLLRLVVVASV